MNRLETYKQKRRAKRIIFLTIFLSLIILVIGFIVVDYTVNSMLGMEDEIKILTMVKKGDAIYEINAMNCTGRLDFSYLKRDIEQISRWIKEGYIQIENYVFQLEKYVRTVMNMK